MNISIIQHGFAALIPSLTVLIILSILGIGLFLTGRATALNHLKKYHLESIYDDEVTKITAENAKYRLIIEQLKRDNKKFTESLSGVRYILRKGE